MIIIYIILGLIGVFVLFGIIGTIQEKNSPSTNQSNKKQKESGRKSLPTVYQLVQEVQTIEDFKKLRTSLNRAEKSYQNSQSNNPIIEKKYRTYEEAFWKASDKVLYKQFVPNLDISMSKEKIKNAYKIIPISEYENFRNEIGGTEYEWIDISANDFVEKHFEKKPYYFESLQEFQKITEDDSKSYDEKISLINEFGKSHKSFVDEFFYGINPNQLGEEWIKEKFHELKIPLVDKIYELGYTSPEKLKNIDIEEIKKVNGFGPKKIEQLKQAIEHIQTTHNSGSSQIPGIAEKV